MTLSATAVAGLFLIVVEVARSAPELRRVLAHRSSDGLSGSSLGILAGTGAGWIVLAVMLEAWWVLAANLIWFGFHLVVCFAVAKVSAAKTRPMVVNALVSAAIVPAVVLAASPWLSTVAALGLLLGASGLVYGVPALIEGLRSATTRGLSAIALSVNVAEGIVYAAVGAGLISLAGGTVAGYLFFGVVAVACNLPRLIRVLWRRAHGADQAAEVAVRA